MVATEKQSQTEFKIWKHKYYCMFNKYSFLIFYHISITPLNSRLPEATTLSTEVPSSVASTPITAKTANPDSTLINVSPKHTSIASLLKNINIIMVNHSYFWSKTDSFDFQKFVSEECENSVLAPINEHNFKQHTWTPSCSQVILTTHTMTLLQQQNSILCGTYIW